MSTKEKKLNDSQELFIEGFLNDYRQVIEDCCIGDMMSFLDNRQIDYSHAFAEGFDDDDTNGIIRAVYRDAYFDQWHKYVTDCRNAVRKEIFDY